MGTLGKFFKVAICKVCLEGFIYLPRCYVVGNSELLTASEVQIQLSHTKPSAHVRGNYLLVCMYVTHQGLPNLPLIIKVNGLQ